MTRVYWDTMLFAYWFEDNPAFKPRMSHIHQAMQERGHRLCASMFTLCELMVSPCKHQDEAGMQGLQSFFAGPAVELLPLRPDAASPYAVLRAEARLRPPDALHLAIAAAHGVDLFLTNDRQLQKLHVPGIAFIAGLDSGLY